jgi:hypothetical protein
MNRLHTIVLASITALPYSFRVRPPPTPMSGPMRRATWSPGTTSPARARWTQLCRGGHPRRSCRARSSVGPDHDETPRADDLERRREPPLRAGDERARATAAVGDSGARDPARRRRPAGRRTSPDASTATCAVREMMTLIDYDANFIRVILPRGCLSRPRWVRDGLAANTSNDKVTGVDEAMDEGRSSEYITLVPRVFR